MIERRRTSLLASLGLLAAAAFATGVAGQAVCTAPHSSIGVSHGGSLSTLLPGGGWVQLSGYMQSADERFSLDGERRPFFLQGESSIHSAYLTVAYGVFEGVDVWAQTSLARVRYSDASSSSGRTGLGDVRVAARIALWRLGLNVPVNVRFGAKIPGSRFPVDARILPLSEGQPDLELSIESSRRLPLGLYAAASAGYRWRFGESAASRHPADEWFGRAALGAGEGIVRFELAAEGLHGGAPVQNGIRLVTDQRRMLQLAPSLSVLSGLGRLEVSAQLPLLGRNLPSDPGVSLGYRVSW